jgi:DNA-binding transcriptional regulator WhiA
MKWKKEEIDFLKIHYKDKGPDFCLNSINRSKRAIIKKAHVMGIKFKEPTLSLKDKEFIKENYLKFGARYCSDVLNKKYSSITSYVSKEGLTGQRTKNREKHNSYYKTNPDIYIKPKTKEIAYILGFIWADGYVSKSKNKYINITMDKRDFKNELSKMINKTGNWNLYKYNNKSTIQINLSNDKIHKFLVENDYLEKSTKSPDKILSKIPNELKNYFFRGYFDGDGSFFINKKYGYKFSFVSDYNQDWNFIENLLIKMKIKYSKIKEIHKYTGYRCSKIICSNKDGVIKLANFLYENDDIQEVGYNRKYEKVKKIL